MIPISLIIRLVLTKHQLCTLGVDQSLFFNVQQEPNRLAEAVKHVAADVIDSCNAYGYAQFAGMTAKKVKKDDITIGLVSPEFTDDGALLSGHFVVLFPVKVSFFDVVDSPDNSKHPLVDMQHVGGCQ